MSTRRVYLMGLADCINDTAEATVRINGETVFSGQVRTKITEENPNLDLVVEKAKLYGYNAVLCSFDIDKNLSGNLGVEIFCNKGIIYFSHILFNFCARIHKIVSVQANDVSESFNNYLDVTYDPAYKDSVIVETFYGHHNCKKNQTIGNVYKYLKTKPNDPSLRIGLENTFALACDRQLDNQGNIIDDGWSNVTLAGNDFVRTTAHGTIYKFSNLPRGIGFFNFMLNQGETFTATLSVLSKYLIDPDGDLEMQLANVPYAVGDEIIDFSKIYGWVEQLPYD